MSGNEEKLKALMSNATIIGEPKGKVAVLDEAAYIEMKALAEKARSNDVVKAELTELKTQMAKWQADKESAEITGAVSAIMSMDKDFKVEVFCEGISEHSMKMRMLNAYKAQLGKVAPALPSSQVTKIQVQDAELEQASMDMLGMPMSKALLEKRVGGN